MKLIVPTPAIEGVRVASMTSVPTNEADSMYIIVPLKSNGTSRFTFMVQHKNGTPIALCDTPEHARAVQVGMDEYRKNYNKELV